MTTRSGIRASWLALAALCPSCSGNASATAPTLDASDCAITDADAFGVDVAAVLDAVGIDGPVRCSGSRVDGRCRVELARGEVRPYNLAITATHLYWTTTFVPSPGHGKLMRVAFAGGAPEELAPGQAGDNPHSIVVDDTSVYWTDFTATGAIMKMPLAGGAPTTLVTGQDEPHGLAVDATSVYWTTYLTQGQIRRAPKTVPEGEIAPVTNLAIAEDQPNNVTVAGAFVYWTNSIATRGTVRKALVDGSSDPTTIAAMQDAPYGIAVDAINVYWTTTSGGQVMKVPLDGSAAPVALASGQDQPFVVTVDAVNVYWANFGSEAPATLGAIRKVPIAGGPLTELAEATSFDVVVDSSSVYWTSYEDRAADGVSVVGGSVFQMTPK